MALILLVEDEKLLRWALSEQLKRAGHEVHDAPNLEIAGKHLEEHQPDVLLLDISLPDGNGLDFYEQNLHRLEDTVAIVMTAVGAVEEAVRAMKLGALDFLNKPVDNEDLVKLIERSLIVRSEHLEVQAARQSRERELKVDLVAESDACNQVLEVVENVARSEVSTLLIQGESGTGKNVLARYIHAISKRNTRPILELSCAAIPDTLMESELLGHERGAFTDAKSTRKGIFELADSGTVVLDEIGELKLELQAKLLHILEERKLRRVGGSREIHIDVRVIGLTNRDLAAMVREGTFREDLFYRLNIFPITVPPLRDRADDILPLARYFLDTLQPKLGRTFNGFSREAENLLLSYAWPGNVRELRNIVERAMILDRSDQIQAGSLILDQTGAIEGPDDSGAAPAIVPLEQMERDLVVRAMQATGNNQTRAAELLEITRDQLRYRLKKFGLMPDS
jgi:DNA-binding NtrC family response regulator